MKKLLSIPGAIMFLVLFTSCSATKKIKTESTSTKNNDSTSVTKVDSSHTLEITEVKKEVKQESQALELTYEPNATAEDYVEVNLNGNKIKVPTKGLKNLKTYNSSNTNKSDSIGLNEEEQKIMQQDIATHTNETAATKSEVEKSGWISDLFAGPVSKIIYIVAGFVILLIIGYIIFLYLRYRKRKKSHQ